MDTLALTPSKFSMPVCPPNPTRIMNGRWSSSPAPARGEPSGGSGRRRSRLPILALRNGSGVRESQIVSETVLEKFEIQNFASISSSNCDTSTVSGTQYSMPIPRLNIGSPLLWIGMGIGLSALFSAVATKLKRRAIQKAFKTVMGQMEPQDDQYFSSTFSPGSPIPSPAASPSAPTASAPTPAASQTVVEVDVCAAKDEAAPPTEVVDETELSPSPAASPSAPASSQTVVAVDVCAAKDEAASPTEVGDETELSIEANKNSDLPASD